MSNPNDLPIAASRVPEEPSLDIKGILLALLKRSWLIVVLGVAGGCAGGWYAQHIRDFYRSVEVIQVESKERSPIRVDDNGQQDLKDPETVMTLIENFQNRSLMERVSEALGLMNDPAFTGGKMPMPPELLVSTLQKGTSAVIRPRTRLIDVSFTHADPRIARKITAALVDQFIKQSVEQRYNAVETQNSVLVQKSAELRQKLESSEAALQEYQKKVGGGSLEEARSLMTSKNSTLGGQLTAARNEVQRLEVDLRQVRAADGREEILLAIPSIVKDSAVVRAKEQVAAQVNEISSLTLRYRDKYPKMIEARNRLETLRQGLREALANAPALIQNQLTTATTQERSLRQLIDEQEKAALELDDKLMPLRALQRNVDADRSLYDAVVHQMKQTTLAMGIEPVAFHVVEPALPAVPLPNRRVLILAGGTFGGLLLGAGIIVALFLLDSSIRSVDDAERLLRLPVIAAVPAMGRLKSARNSLAVFNNPGSASAESFRSLRTSLSLSTAGDKSRVILVTSAVPGEGKTLTSANIAIAFAQQGLSTLLVDADLRRPSIGNLFELRRDAPGLTEYLTGGPVEFCATKIPHLTIMPSGSPAPRPAELLTGPVMGELIETLKLAFDRIVIDTAPVNVVSDTLNFASCASAVCLVIRSRSTSLRVVRRAVELLRRAKVRPAGIALNCLPTSGGHDYYYHYSSNGKYGGDGTYGGGDTETEATVTKITQPGLLAAKIAAPLTGQP